MKTLKFAAAALAFSAVTAIAQTPTAPSSEQKAAVAALLEALNFKQMMSQVATASAASMPQMVDQMTASMLDGAGDALKVEARKSLSANMAKLSQGMTDIYKDPIVLAGIEEMMTRMYLKYFTAEEIRATTAFYVSPVGRKSLAVTPQLMQEMMPEMMKLVAPKMNDLAQKFAKDIVADAKNSAAAGKNK